MDGFRFGNTPRCAFDQSMYSLESCSAQNCLSSSSLLNFGIAFILGTSFSPADYRKDPDLSWHHLVHAHESMVRRLQEMRQLTDGTGVNLTMTEGHFALPGDDRCQVLSSWAAGVSYTRAVRTATPSAAQQTRD